MRIFTLISKRLLAYPLMKREASRSTERIATKTRKTAISRPVSSAKESTLKSNMFIKEDLTVLPSPKKSLNDKKDYRQVKQN